MCAFHLCVPNDLMHVQIMTTEGKYNLMHSDMVASIS